MAPVIGRCKLCGKTTELTYEHVPPSSAFNKWRTRVYPGKELITHIADQQLPWDLSRRKWVQYQRGYGGYTLCKNCNNYTGRKYVPAYTDFCKQVFEQIVEQGETRGHITISFKGIFPLRIFKQILCMFLSINHFEFGERHPEIRKSVIDSHLRSDLTCASVFSYANIGKTHRVSGISGIYNVAGGWSRFVSELGAIPLGFVLEMKPPREKDLTPMSDFLDYDFEEKANMDVRFPIKESNSYFPLDYRTKKEIYDQIDKSRRIE